MAKVIESDVTLGVSCKGNMEALQMCLSGVLAGTSLPGKIQIRLEGDPPGFRKFYFGRLIEWARMEGVEFKFQVCKSTGVRDSRDWQFKECLTEFLWMLDDDVVPDGRCLAAYREVMSASPGVAFYSGSKCDVSNLRGYPGFDTSLHGKSDLDADANHSLRYDIDECWGLYAPANTLDTGNTLFSAKTIKESGCKFRLFPDSFNPSGDATTFSLVLAKAGLKGVFAPSACSYHLEKEGGGFNEFQARGEMLLRLCEVKGFDKNIILKHWMPFLTKPDSSTGAPNAKELGRADDGK